MKYICLYKHPQLPLCRIAQSPNANDLKEWVCIKAYRYDAPAAAILKQFATIVPNMKAEDIYNVKPAAFIEAFDTMLEAAKPPKRSTTFRLLAFAATLVLLALHCATRVALIPLSICLLILMGGSLHATAMIAVLYRATNLKRVILKTLTFCQERSAK